MIKHERLAYLLNRLMAEEATGEEHAEMLLLIQDPANEDFAKSEIFTAYQTARNLQDLVPEKKQQILEAIFRSDREHKPPAVLTGSFGWRRWAAAAILVTGISVIGFYLLRKSEPAPALPVAQKTDIQAGGNKATLTLADGKVISLTDADNGKIATEAGLVITKQADGQLLYEAVDIKGEAGGYNTITTPYGGKYKIVLQDGTSVILNSGTSITYPIAFSKDLRKVTLTGEAYFEIAKNESKPFIVNIQIGRA
ncbi:MAG: FecR domain-containing protein, partial [Pseudobacter sp.]|uniref:FecR domain-containing protein n=1 Tax=Pseudobacter sp. TaxID=2045420 RepID=UPI003F803BAF